MVVRCGSVTARSVVFFLLINWGSGLVAFIPLSHAADPFNNFLHRDSPPDQSRATFSAVVEEAMPHNVPFLSLCAARELLRCELCKDDPGNSVLHENAHAALRRAASAMPGTREDLIALLRTVGLEKVLG